jgi:hypothetical protein
VTRTGTEWQLKEHDMKGRFTKHDKIQTELNKSFWSKKKINENSNVS